MVKISSKKDLAVALSKLKGFISAKVRVEQYMTDSEVAADVLWNCKLQGDLRGVVADLGAGTGILGIGAVLLGAEKAVFVENDKEALEMLKANLGTMDVSVKSEVFEGSLETFRGTADLVIMNPPFGTKERHADKAFLEKAFSVAPVVVSLHKTATKVFVESIAQDNGFKVTHRWDYGFPLKRSMQFHRKRIQRIEVSAFRMAKKGHITSPSPNAVSQHYDVG